VPSIVMVIGQLMPPRSSSVRDIIARIYFPCTTRVGDQRIVRDRNK
jgi:hypothetical protein